MCAQALCPKREICYRAQAKPSRSGWQSMQLFAYKIQPDGTVYCADFIAVAEERRRVAAENPETSA